MLKERVGAAYAPSARRRNDEQSHEDRDDDSSNVRLDTNDLDGTVLATEEVTTTTAVVTTEGVVQTAVAPPEGVTEAMDKKYGTHRRSGLWACKAPMSSSMSKVPQPAAKFAYRTRAPELF